MNQQAELSRAYAACRSIAKREAKNFYYAFLALPREKRDAICAVYAFMRHADDISDDESVSREQRQHMMREWMDAWHVAAQGSDTQNVVFIAVRDAQQRFGIPGTLLDQLVAGTAMDLEREPAATDAFATFATFEELYRYCYLVASVVGLVCIRIFGYREAAAEGLAEETGIAFQLTNILRDVREDAERHRIYLPLDEMAQHGTTPERIAIMRESGMGEGERALLRKQAERAHVYYQSTEKLIALIDPDSRPALAVLVKIYRRLLDRIEARNCDVFSQRVSVPKLEKWAILMCGLGQVVRARMAGARLGVSR